MKNLRIIHIRMINGTIFAPRKSKLKKKLMMKKNLVFLLGACLLTGSMLFTGCAADDITAPVVTLNGNNPQTVTLNGTYTEAGATATDDEDGDLTSSIVITGADAIDEDMVGEYEVHYSVSDAAGNVGEAHRTVNVANAAAAWGGVYSVKDTCPGFLFTYAQTVTASAIINNRIGFNKFADYSGNDKIYAEISGSNSLTIPLQTATGIGSLGETHRFSGTGTKTSTGFTITYVDENVTQSASTTCTATFTK